MMPSGGNVVAKAWVQIIPEMSGIQGEITKELTREMSDVGEKAGEALGKGISSSLDSYADKIAGIGDKLTLGITTPLAAAGASIASTAVDFDNAASTIEAAVGGDVDAAEDLMEVGRDLWRNGWAKSMDELTPALVDAYEVLGDIGDEDLRTAIRGAETMERVWGADINESLRGVNILMDAFGLSAQEATDLMVAGSQRGLNYTNELGDNLAEYAGRWGDAGISASEYFSLLEAGTQNGAYNLDRVGDFLNEFLTSLSDGRMEEGIAAFSEGTQAVWESYKEGGATAQDVLQAVVGELANGKTETEAMAIASQLWSSLGEDNCLSMIQSLSGVTDSFGDVSGATDQAAGAIEDSIGNRATSAVNRLKEAFEPVMEDVVGLIEKAADLAEQFSSWYSSLDEGTQEFIVNFAAIAAAAGPVMSVGGRLAKGAGSLAKGLGKVAGSAKTTATTAKHMASAATTAGTAAVGLGTGLAGASAAGAAVIGTGIELTSVWQAAGRDFEGDAARFATATQTMADAGAVVSASGVEVKSMYSELGAGTTASIQQMQTWAESFRGASTWAFELFPQNKENFENQYRQMFNSIDQETIGGWLAVQASTVAAGEPLTAANASNVSSILNTYSVLKDYLPEDSHQALVAMAQAMEGTIPELAGAADMSSEEIIATMRSVLLDGGTGTGATGKQAGDELGGGFSGGMSGRVGDVESSGRSLASAAESAKDNNANASSWGSELGSNFASGIKSMWSTVCNAASSLAGAVASFLHFSEPDVGPLVGINDSGRELAQNYANAMLDGVPAVRNAAGALAGAASFAGQARWSYGISGSGTGPTTYNVYIDGSLVQTDAQMAEALDGLLAGVRRTMRLGVA